VLNQYITIEALTRVSQRSLHSEPQVTLAELGGPRWGGYLKRWKTATICKTS
jgi:hypothetical protein